MFVWENTIVQTMCKPMVGTLKYRKTNRVDYARSG